MHVGNNCYQQYFLGLDDDVSKPRPTAGGAMPSRWLSPNPLLKR
ncbi:hypothetical protein LAUMK42_02597 [Mycobacterium persicum]|uniref:Uncharacterized protein n=1 Tax=Mycobacterium persicum TaxID=1487726 RepID=A0AB38UT16_9MYCO|nr:hypothetical protein LAUMK42_02597 [Mycobacterium persicum]